MWVTQRFTVLQMALSLWRGVSCGRLGTVSLSPFGAHPRLRPMKPPYLDEMQQKLYKDVVDTRAKVIGRDTLFDENGGLRGPWNAEVTSPLLGKHLERFATAVRESNSLDARIYEIAILVVGVNWQSQFEWYAHEKIARKAGVCEEAFPLIKTGAPAEQLEGILKVDELSVYRLALELMQTKRVSAQTYAETKTLLGGDDKKMADLCMTMGCYSAVCNILNMFEVPLPEGVCLPFPEPQSAS